MNIHFYPRPVLAFGYCRSLRLCLSVCLSVCQSLACSRDNAGPVQAKITKFGPKMQKTFVKVPIVLRTDPPWPWRSNFNWKSKFTPFWACPHHYSPPIQARITKFGPEVQNTLVEILIVLWGAIDLDLQGQIWVKKSNFQVLPYWKYITTKEPWVPRLFHERDCFTVSIRCMCSYAKTVSRSQLFHSQHVAPILIWAAEGMSALTSLLFFHDLTRTWGASYMHENQRIRMSWTYLDGFCNQQGHPGEGGRTWYDDR